MEKSEKKMLKLIFIIYIIVVLRVIVFKIPLVRMQEIMSTWTREIIFEGMDSANFELFKTIKMYIRYWGRGLNSFQNLVGNVVVFIPLGYLLPRLSKAAQNGFVCMLNVLAFVVSIEVFQLISAFGAFDVDDILLNCAGALVGYLIFIFTKLSVKKKSLIK